MTAFLILHVAPDHDAVAQLAARLTEAGITPVLAEVRPRVGGTQRKQLRQRLLATQAIVVVISAASADSDALLREVEFARRVKGGDEPIIPLVIGPPTAGSPFDGLPVGAVVVNELRHLDAVNARDGSDPLPPLRRFLAPASSYPNGYLFISYSTPNRATVEAYAQRLHDEHNIDVWWFEGRQRAGANYRRTIMQRIKAARAVIVVLSKRSANSRSVLYEVAYARRVGTPIISVRIGESASEPSLTAEVRHGAVAYDLRGYPILDGRAGRDPLPDLVNLLGSPERLRAAPLPATARDLRGTLLRKYAVDERIATTATSVVYKAWDRDLKRAVAIKVMLPTSDRPREQLARFQAEAERVAQLEHPYIVRLHDSWVADDQIYLVMGWMPQSLAEQVPGPPLPLKRVARTFAQVAAALTYAHIRGVFHCDLKPGNILLDAGGEASLADFGIAQEAHRRAGIVAFSRGYAPPEQLRGAPPQAQTDIYSLAVVLWELLTGRRLFDGEPAEVERLQREAVIPSVTTFRPELPAALDDALCRALDPDPAARFPDVPSFRAAVDEAFVLALRASGLPEPEVQLSVRPPELPVAPNPYKFLRPFEEADAANFFGRERLVAELLERLDQPDLDGRFVALVGASGSGKSSAVRAGLIPAYRQRAEQGGWRLVVIVVRPGARPIEHLAEALARPRSLAADELATEIRAEAEGLPRAIDRALANEPTAELLLVVDQLEELFAAGVDLATRRAFLAGLVAAVNMPGSRTRLILTLRADFFGEPLADPAFGPLMRGRSIEVLPLDEAELEDAIRKPAARAGMGVETALVREMIADVAAQPGQLPLLQFALAQLYDGSVWTVLTLRGYQELGGVEGALTTRADTVYAKLGPAEQGLAKQIFLRLVTPGDGTEDTRRRVRMAELELLGAGDAPVAMTSTTERRRDTPGLNAADPSAATLDAGVVAAQGDSIVAPDAPTQDAVAEHAQAPAGSNAAPDAPTLAADAAVPGQPVRGDAEPDAITLDLGAAEGLVLAATPAAQDFARTNGSAAVTTVLRALDRTRLLSFDRDQVSHEPTVEVAHEVLFHRERGWPLLRGWLSAARDELRTQRKLSAAALEWQQRGEAAYLATGGPLAEFEELATKGDLALNPLEQAFIATSVAERDRTAAEQEAARQRELEQVRQLAAEQAERAEKERELATVANLRAEEQATSNRRLRRRAVFLALALVAAIVAASAAGLFSRQATLNAEEADQQRNEAVAQRGVAEENARLAEDRAAIARVQQLAAQADASDDPQLAALLAMEALNLAANTPAPAPRVAEQALRDAASGIAGRGFSTLHQGTSGAFVGTQGRDGTIAVAVSPDQRTLASAGGEGEIFVWDLDAADPDETTRRLTGHTNIVTLLALTPDGETLVSGSYDGTVRIWDLTQKDPNQTVRILQANENGVYAFVMSYDGKKLFTGGADNTIKVWDLTASTETTPLQILPYSNQDLVIYKLALNRDGTLLVSGHLGGSLGFWDLTQPDPAMSVRIVQAHTGGLGDLVFRETNQSLISGGGDGLIKIWDPRAADPTIGTVTLSGHGATLHDLVLSADELRLVSGSSDKTIRVWDLSTADPTASARMLTGHSGAVLALSLSDDGSILASRAGTGEPTIRIWELDDPDPNRTVRILAGHGTAVLGLQLSPDGHTLYSGGLDGTTRIWEVNSPENAAARVLTASLQPANPTIAGSPENIVLNAVQHRLASSDASGTIRVWDLMEGDREPTALELRVAKDEASILKLSEDGDLLASGGNGGVVRVWDLSSSNPQETVRELKGLNGIVRALAISPDKQRIAAYIVNLRSTELRVWDLRLDDPNKESRLLVENIEVMNINPLQLTFGEDSSKLYSLGQDIIRGTSPIFIDTIRIWDLESALPSANVRALQGEQTTQLTTLMAALAIDVSPDGNYLASGHFNGEVRLWDLKASDPNQSVQVLSGHEGSVYQIRFTPDGRRLLSGSKDGTIGLWDLQTPEPARSVRYLRGHESGLNGIALRSDGLLLASISEDDTIRIWDLTVEDPNDSVLTLRGHTDDITHLALSSDERHLYTVSADGTARIWPLDPRDLIAPVCRAVGRNLTLAEWEQYFPGEAYRRTCPDLPDGAGVGQ